MNVICFGDSNTWGYDPRSRFGDRYPAGTYWTDILASKTGWNVVNEGVNGREVPCEAASIPDHVNLYLVMLGTNDLLQLDTPEAAAERMESFLSGTDPQKVILIAPPSMVWGEWVQDQELIDDSKRMTQLYRDLADRCGVCFLDAGEWNISMSYDGVHFTQEGHKAFAEGLIKELVK